MGLGAHSQLESDRQDCRHERRRHERGDCIRVARLDLSALRARLVRTLNFAESEVDAALIAYRQFLELKVAFDDHGRGPPEPVAAGGQGVALARRRHAQLQGSLRSTTLQPSSTTTRTAQWTRRPATSEWPPLA
mmetsp:Transcript_35781/g.82879  ORF Transcript_35781/g.82879 Transcript_35781/m.82879 type:complete len:134 (-) Transcript_35781:406-807(-)